MKKFVNKFLAVAVAFVTAVAMMPLGSGSVAYAEESPITENVKYFSTTMYNFDQNTFNTVTDTVNGVVQQPNQSNFYFIGENPNPTVSELDYVKWQKGRVNSGANTDNGNYNVLVQGIVKDTLDSSGNIQFNYKNAGVFASPQTKIAGRDVYQNVQFPFVYTNDGYYTFDSENNHVHSGKVDGETLNLYENSQIIRNKGTFFPFNEDSDTKADYHFGMSMSVPFYMNEDGKLENGENMKFEFSGDDDVWVFINGKLVLDLGGIHGAIGGSIDFATGEVKYTHSSEKVYAIQGNSALTTKQEIQDKKVNLYTNLGINKTDLASGENNLQIFYLERGCSESNCKIRFNLLQKDTLEVSKTLGTKTPYTESAFQFQLLKKNDNDLYEPVSNKAYTLYNGSSLVNGNYATDEDGKFNLQAGQRANFTDNVPGDYKVVELTGGYDTEWKLTKENNQINGKVDGENAYTIPIAKNELGGITKYTLNCVNYAEVKLIDDTIVLDYGKPVQYNVRDNDTSQSKKSGISVYGIGESSLAKDETTAVGYTTLNTDVALNNGNIKINSDGVVTYTPTRYMSSVDKANYVVNYQVRENYQYIDQYAYATVNVLPATSVYYEDDFGTTGNTDSEVSIVWGGKWDPVYNDTTTVEDQTQSSKNDRYGWDDSYKDNLGYSNDSATKTDEKGATATFTFTGTGVDVYSRTNGAVGLIRAQLYSGKGVLKEDGKTPKAAIDIQYIDNISTSGDYYQIPTLSFENLDYGTYTVVITAGAMGTGTAGTYYLDGIRVYNPLQGNATAEKAYGDAEISESGAQYIKLRDTLLENGFGSIEEGKTSVEGSVFIDDINGDSVTNGTKADYEKYGPKNEVYLAKGQAIAFEIEGYEDAVTKPNLFIGLKALNATTQVTFTNGTGVSEESINSSSDLYYRVIPTSSGKVIIRNTGENLLSITKLRITNTNATVALVSSQSLLSYAQEFDSLKVVENTDEDNSSDNDNKDEILDKDDVDIDNPSDDDNSQEINNTIWNTILNYIKNWFKK